MHISIRFGEEPPDFRKPFAVLSDYIHLGAQVSFKVFITRYVEGRPFGRQTYSATVLMLRN